MKKVNLNFISYRRGNLASSVFYIYPSLFLNFAEFISSKENKIPICNKKLYAF